MNEDIFYLQVAHALSGCQMVEQQLKLYAAIIDGWPENWVRMSKKVV